MKSLINLFSIIICFLNISCATTKSNIPQSPLVRQNDYNGTYKSFIVEGIRVVCYEEEDKTARIRIHYNNSKRELEYIIHFKTYIEAIEVYYYFKSGGDYPNLMPTKVINDYVSYFHWELRQYSDSNNFYYWRYY